MHMVRRGGHKSGKKVDIKDIDGFGQSLRQQVTEADLEKRVGNDGKGFPGGTECDLVKLTTLPQSDDTTTAPTGRPLGVIGVPLNDIPVLSKAELQNHPMWIARDNHRRPERFRHIPPIWSMR